MMTQNIPIISTIIPTRNRPDLVYRAVESALNQTWQSIEVIVVIDGPDDATVAALDRITDPRLKKILLPENRGVAAARNAGIQVAKGSWIALLDDDDRWLPEKLERQMKIAGESSYSLPIVSCLFFLHPHVDLRRGILADAHEDKAGNDAAAAEDGDARGGFRVDFPGDRAAVDQVLHRLALAFGTSGSAPISRRRGSR